MLSWQVDNSAIGCADAGWWRGRDSVLMALSPDSDLRGLPFAAEREQVEVDEVGMRGGEAVRQTRIVDFQSTRTRGTSGPNSASAR